MSPIISYNKILLTGETRGCTPKLPAFAETLRAGRRYGTQAWLSAKAGKNPNFYYFVEEI
jgi:hypothetical protein